MTLSDRRLDRLLPALSAQERALLMLRDFKAEKPQDRQLLNTAPDAQTSALNRLIGLMNAANGDLAHVIVIIRERVRQEELRFNWLQWARMCAVEMWAVRAHFNVSAREAITESEYRKRQEEDAKELLPIEECATFLTEEHTWDDADCETGEDGEPSATDEAWYRVRDEKIAELRALVADGTLAGKGKGKRMKIACGSFYGWLGEPVPVVPELGIGFDVRADDREREVARARADHAFIQDVLNRGACMLELPLDMASPLDLEPPRGGFGVELARLVAVSIRVGVRENWQELRAIDEQVEAITEEYGGEDVLHARVRENLDETKAMLIDLHEQLQEYTGPFELPEPDDDLRATIQHVVDNEIAHLPTR